MFTFVAFDCYFERFGRIIIIGTLKVVFYFFSCLI
jgi:hypothetical protein